MAPRILLYSHDTFGLGHFRRCMKIARHLNVVLDRSSVLLLTGSPMAHRYPMPDGVDFVKLPAVVKTGPEQYESRSARLPIGEMTGLRAEIIRNAAIKYQPDVFLVDHAPHGLRGEVLPTLRQLREEFPRCLTVLGLRDILDDPSTVVPLWESSGVYKTMGELYDQIVIYGTPDIYEPTVEYRFPAAVIAKTSYVGYITGGDLSQGTTRTSRRQEKLSRVLITVGGGDDGQRIVETYINMLRETGHGDEMISTVLPGPLLAAPEVDRLRRMTRGLGVRIRHFVEDVTPLIQRADLTISMGGYNAVSEILTYAKRALIIPRDTPRLEQLMRAERLRDAGLVSMVRMNDLDSTKLLAAIHEQLHLAEEPLATARADNTIPLNGSDQLARLLKRSLGARKNGGQKSE